MRHLYLYIIILVVGCGNWSSANATDVLTWNKTPLHIRLNVGEERMVIFTDNVRLGLPPQLMSDLKITNAGGVLYLTARKPFPDTRISVQYVTNNKQVLVDLFATKPDGNEEKLDDIKVVNQSEEKKAEEAQSKLFESSSAVSLKTLIQYASRDFYAPPRLKMSGLPITETKVTQPLHLDILWTNQMAGLFDLVALKQYQTTNYTLTAIMLSNRTNKQQHIILRDLYPDQNIITATAQHLIVGPHNSDTDTTIFYLVTKDPLTSYGIYSL